MKRTLTALIGILILWSAAFAQNATQPASQTNVADVLARLPASQRVDFDAAMADLTAAGSNGVISLADMLVPADKCQNNIVEYALSGLVAYASGHATDTQLSDIRKGLAAAIDNCTDITDKAFLLTLLSRISSQESIPVFMRYLDNPDLTEWAQSGLIQTPGSEEAIMTLIKDDGAPHHVLARMAGAMTLTEAEPALLSWLPKADDATSASICKALSKIGSAKSLQVLAKVAAKENYRWLPSDATAAYTAALNRLAANGTAKEKKAVAKSARDLLNKCAEPHVRTAAIAAVLTASGKQAESDLLKSMSDTDRAFRVAALRHCEPWADEATYSALGAIATDAKAAPQTRADIINWFGTNKISQQIDAITANMDTSDDETATAAISAASKIGGDKALAALISQLNGSHSGAAQSALLSFNGNINDAIIAALAPDQSPDTRSNALAIASTRKIKAAAPIAFSLLGNSDKSLAKAAYKALPGVITIDDLNKLCGLLDQSTDSTHTSLLQTAIIAALHSTDTSRYAAVAPFMTASAHPDRYYPVIASTGSDEAVAELLRAYEAGQYREAALDAMLGIDNPSMSGVLYDIATTNPQANAKALKRYAWLTSRYGGDNINRYHLYRRGLEASQSADVSGTMLAGLAKTGTYQALMIADRYISDPATADAAAAAIRSIMSKHTGEYAGAPVRAALEKAADRFRADKDNPDAGYAVDDINGMLARLDAIQLPAPSSRLTDQEKAEGWQMLFDGSSLNCWTGDTANYNIADGILAPASAKARNLYTVDQYGDFVLRFEFRLDEEGVNNGIGIRTPRGVDAAYHGMEIQILDHDAPRYAKLAPYQVHGSVYGVIPAKRVKFKPGEWNTEEIRANGDHITVTVNGRVILDGNIREACKGHAVSEDGSDTNPWMCDKRNHPGLFNKNGHIGLLGHGHGISFRNIRILDQTGE